MAAVGDHREASVDLLTVTTGEPGHATAVPAQRVRHESRQEARAAGARPPEYPVVEDAAWADDGGSRLASRGVEFAIAGRDQAQAADRIGVGSHVVPDAERLQRGDALRRQTATARLVAWEVRAVDHHHVAHAETDQSKRGGRPRGSGADHRDVGVYHARRARRAAPA